MPTSLHHVRVRCMLLLPESCSVKSSSRVGLPPAESAHGRRCEGAAWAQLSALRGRTHDRCMRSRGADGCRCMLCYGSAITSPRSMYQFLFMDIDSASSPYSCTYMYIHFFSKSRLHFIEPYFTTSI